MGGILVMDTNKKIISEVSTHTVIDANGKKTTTTTETTKKYEKLSEPDYIKIYTNMWCTFNGIPETYARLFLSLAVRMSYCNSTNLERSQLVNTGKPWRDDIMKECGWTSEASIKKGLKVLVEHNAIRRVARGIYQINPSFAGKGLWKYNPKEQQGGIVDLIATFKFKDKSVDTQVVWQADEEYVKNEHHNKYAMNDYEQEASSVKTTVE